MPDKSWKAFERRIAQRFPNARRRGPDTTGGKCDLIAPGWAVECKLLGRPSFSDLLDAARQAERNAEALQTPVAIVKRKHDEDRNALVVMRLEEFSQWFVGGIG